MRDINTIFVHCAATRPDWLADQSAQAKLIEIDRWHRDRGFDGFGYHYLIDRDGKVVAGRPLAKIGAHVRGHNAKSVGICLVGGFGSDAGDAFSKNFTPAQDMALRALIDTLQEEFPGAKVRGHNEVANKACPGFNVQQWFSGDTRKAVVAASAIKTTERTSPVQSTTVQASAVQIATGAGTAISGIGMLDGTAQIVALIFGGIVILAGLWIMKERLRKFAEGDR
jgi:hypothetical protein